MISIPSPLVEFMLLGPLEDRRQLQDSPILGDVWVKFGQDPSEPADLLISPYRDQHAGEVAQKILEALVPNFQTVEKLERDPQIGFLQGLIVASLTFPEVIEIIVPRTNWWSHRWRSNEEETGQVDQITIGNEKVDVGKHDLEGYEDREIKEAFEKILESVKLWRKKGTTTESQDLPALDRFIALTGLILWAHDRNVAEKKAEEASKKNAEAAAPKAEASPPEKSEASPPESGEASPPESGEASPPEGGEASPPEGAEASPPEGGEASPPESGEAPPPEGAEASPSESPGQPTPETTASPAPDSAEPEQPMTVQEQIDYILKHAKADDIARSLVQLKTKMLGSHPKGRIPEPEGLIWSVSLNRQPMPALIRSIGAVKADAAQTLFKVNCSDIAWAVIDSGIDGSHPALIGRVKKSYDFKNFRRIVNVSNSNPWLLDKTLTDLKADDTWKCLQYKFKDDEEAKSDLKTLAQDAATRGPIHWQLVEKFVEIDPKTPPRSNHGTHVAGIIGANGQAALEEAKKKATTERELKALQKRSAEFANGMCPDIQLYDFRVLGREIKDWEFGIIAALQFIRYLNDRHSFITIHGANLSLSIPHDVRNFACGRTPICNECERLIESGVVVVAAAGNHGYKSFETKEGSYESYAAFSITDPGNADSVITVGATHRFWPHTYGVSFFSSRGPTGDGRLKPDLVAPGEKIHAPVPGDSALGGEWADLDGTSMAAPHVSGAAAMLMGRYSEFIGQPRRIKRILCENATDLGRERSFQGHGMLDVLRAFQSI